MRAHKRKSFGLLAEHVRTYTFLTILLVVVTWSMRRGQYTIDCQTQPKAFFFSWIYSFPLGGAAWWHRGDWRERREPNSGRESSPSFTGEKGDGTLGERVGWIMHPRKAHHLLRRDFFKACCHLRTPFTIQTPPGPPFGVDVLDVEPDQPRWALPNIPSILRVLCSKNVVVRADGALLCPQRWLVVFSYSLLPLRIERGMEEEQGRWHNRRGLVLRINPKAGNPRARRK